MNEVAKVSRKTKLNCDVPLALALAAKEGFSEVQREKVLGALTEKSRPFVAKATVD